MRFNCSSSFIVTFRPYVFRLCLASAILPLVPASAGARTADAIAMKLGIDKTALVRVRAGISYALTEAMDEGHCGLPTDHLVPLAEKLLEVPQELVRTDLDLE